MHSHNNFVCLAIDTAGVHMHVFTDGCGKEGDRDGDASANHGGEGAGEERHMSMAHAGRRRSVAWWNVPDCIPQAHTLACTRMHTHMHSCIPRIVCTCSNSPTTDMADTPLSTPGTSAVRHNSPGEGARRVDRPGAEPAAGEDAWIYKPRHGPNLASRAVQFSWLILTSACSWQLHPPAKACCIPLSHVNAQRMLLDHSALHRLP